MVRPPRLRPGDTLGVIAPAGQVREERLESGLSALREAGFKLVLGSHLYDRRGYLAGDDAHRAQDLNTMFQQNDIKGIICARGGYGSTRILQLLDFEIIRRNPKVFIGYSDITALHLAIQRRTGLITFHGPMVEVDPVSGFPEYNLRNLLKAVMEPAPLGQLPSPPSGLQVTTVRPGRARGRLVGGNLTLVCSLLGTPYEIDTRGKILFLEDVAEPPYRWDRLLMQLVLAGKIQTARGIIIAEAVNSEPEPGKPSLTLTEIFSDLLVPYSKPTVYGLPAGHGTYKLTLPLGTMVTLNATEREIVVEEPAVY